MIGEGIFGNKLGIRGVLRDLVGTFDENLYWEGV